MIHPTTALAKLPKGHDFLAHLEKQGMKILIVDGGPGSHTGIAKTLVQRGCRLLEVHGSEEALRIAHEEKPEIAIVDLLTPNLNRGEFVRRLRLDPAVARMPVIFYTDGYLEIASGLARDVETLLTPMLLCEDAIQSRAVGELNGSNGSSNGNGEHAQNGMGIVQDVFTFACGSAGEHTLIKPGDLITELPPTRGKGSRKQLKSPVPIPKTCGKSRATGCNSIEF
jgi:CheY-like chemotaxis protein